MTSADARAAVLDALRRVAPEADPAALGDGADLQSDLALDSMDVLHVMAAVEASTGVTVPAADYPLVTTVGALVAYVEAGVTRP